MDLNKLREAAIEKPVMNSVEELGNKVKASIGKVISPEDIIEGASQKSADFLVKLREVAIKKS